MEHQYIESLKMFESMQNDVVEASESAQFIRSTIVDFEKGFDKEDRQFKGRIVQV